MESFKELIVKMRLPTSTGPLTSADHGEGEVGDRERFVGHIGVAHIVKLGDH